MQLAGIGRFVRRHWWPMIVLSGYGVLVLLGISTSSVGANVVRDHPGAKAPGLLLNEPDLIRSDEYLRQTPGRLAVKYSRSKVPPTSPLAWTSPPRTEHSVVGAMRWALAAESHAFAALSSVQLEMAFAAQWWFYTVLVLLLGPRWLRMFGVRNSIGIPVTIAVVLSPVVIWWSWNALIGVAWALAAALSALKLVATREAPRPGAGSRLGWHMRQGGWCLATAYLLARIALTYQPWSLPVGIAILVPTLVLVVVTTTVRWRALGCIATALGVGVAIVYVTTLTGGGSLEQLASTVYPGSRRETGVFRGLALLFGAPHLWYLQSSPELSASNYSAVTSAYTYLLVASAALLPFVRWRDVPRATKSGVWTSMVTAAALLQWSAISMPQFATHMPILNLIPTDRMAQVIGIPAMFVFAFTLEAACKAPRWTRRWHVVAAVFGATFTLLAAAGSDFSQRYAPNLSLSAMIVTALLFAATPGMIAIFARRFGAWPLLLVTVPVVVLVSPVQQGFADMHDGNSAQMVRRHAKELGRGKYVASDDFRFDAILIANAVPSLSGQQSIGPDHDVWRVLDPEEKYINEWNRGASYISFLWDMNVSTPLVELPSQDIIRVRTNPCSPALSRLGLHRIYAVQKLKSPCLAREQQFEFGGHTLYTFVVQTRGKPDS